MRVRLKIEFDDYKGFEPLNFLQDLKEWLEKQGVTWKMETETQGELCLIIRSLPSIEKLAEREG
jgi:hypothetical protein